MHLTTTTKSDWFVYLFAKTVCQSVCSGHVFVQSDDFYYIIPFDLFVCLFFSYYGTVCQLSIIMYKNRRFTLCCIEWKVNTIFVFVLWLDASSKCINFTCTSVSKIVTTSFAKKKKRKQHKHISGTRAKLDVKTNNCNFATCICLWHFPIIFII